MNVDVVKLKLKLSQIKSLWKLYVFQQLALSSVIKIVSMFCLKIIPFTRVKYYK